MTRWVFLALAEKKDFLDSFFSLLNMFIMICSTLLHNIINLISATMFLSFSLGVLSSPIDWGPERPSSEDVTVR